MTPLEEKLRRYTKPSSDTEQDKQDRAERMAISAVNRWHGFDDIKLDFLPKGSYKNNTNVRTDSDVDIAVIQQGVFYYDYSLLHENDRPYIPPATQRHYDGPGFRRALEKAMRESYGTDCDTSGATAIKISENGGRVKADVVPSFHFRLYHYRPNGDVAYHQGTRTWRTTDRWVVNYPEQQYENGVAKNSRTGTRYKKLVRILKRIENDLVTAGKIAEIPSYFMECLIYCTPDRHFNHRGTTPLTDDFTETVRYIWNSTKPDGAANKWLEPNEIKPLFGHGQKWRMEHAHGLALRTWKHMDLGG
ncbi:hypothetical protein ACFV0R_29145 [Streptomyces sp. NPDC059578]|uniref:hypothetical protein n=1 Tax=Streptomyces sp. NPDC059578 TaxID=3346874 RepID=UPI00367FDED8